MTLAPADVLMVGMGVSSPMYYRILLPAHELGIDYVGVVGKPPKARYRTGLVGGESKMPIFADYKVVVLQQPHGEGWFEVIRGLQQHGVKVIYEVDDWLHSIQLRHDHEAREHFDDAALADYELCMEACDALIVSTDYLAHAYRAQRRVFVCRNGIDPARYELTRPSRETVNIGWAGAMGHARTVEPWLQAVAEVMEKRAATMFIAIGQPQFAKPFGPRFGRRAIGVPFCAIEQYPAAMTLIDVALGPADRSGFYRAKSDLRWLEAGALGIPLIGSPIVYPEIEPGVTGLHANQPYQARRHMLELVDDGPMRSELGEAARAHVLEHRTVAQMAPAWWDAFEAVAN
jgi:hypothetical protein